MGSEMCIRDRDRPPIIVYSDAEGRNFHIGLVAWDPLDPERIHSANGLCPLWLREHARSLSPDVCDDDDGMINVVEMVGALALFTTFPDLLRGRRILMYQDNSTAFHCAVTGYCHDAAVRDVGARFHLAAAPARPTKLTVEHSAAFFLKKKKIKWFRV